MSSASQASESMGPLVDIVQTRTLHDMLPVRLGSRQDLRYIVDALYLNNRVHLANLRI